MTEEELQQTFHEFNAVYFRNGLTCEVTFTENWTDGLGNYYADSEVSVGDDLVAGTCAGAKVQLATALYTHSKNLISIPKWRIGGENATRALLLHEMAHAAANEPETEHGPKWHTEMHRLWKQHAPINLQEVTPGHTDHALVGQYGVGSEFWNNL